MSKKAEQVKTRYEKGYVRDDQLKRYLELGAITQEEYDEIYAIRHQYDMVTEETKEEAASEDKTSENTDTVDNKTVKDNKTKK